MSHPVFTIQYLLLTISCESATYICMCVIVEAIYYLLFNIDHLVSSDLVSYICMCESYNYNQVNKLFTISCESVSYICMCVIVEAIRNIKRTRTGHPSPPLPLDCSTNTIQIQIQCKYNNIKIQTQLQRIHQNQNRAFLSTTST